MNYFVREHGNLMRQTQALRDRLMDLLTDDDLGCHPGGENLTLGELLKEAGEIEYDYIQSLKTFKLDWSYHNTEEGLENHVAKLRDWFKTLDDELNAMIEGFSDDDLNQIVERDPWDPAFRIPVSVQLHIYREGLLIFYGKVMIYLKALKKTIPDQWRFWIG